MDAAGRTSLAARLRCAFPLPVYGLPYWLPRAGVVTIHDLTFEHRPEWFSLEKRSTFRLQARHAAKVAATIITVSMHTRDDLVATYGVDPQRVSSRRTRSTPPLRSHRTPGSRAVRSRSDGPYLVALGGAPRRNLAAAVAAWRRLTERGFDLKWSSTRSDATRPPRQRGASASGHDEAAGDRSPAR